MATLPSTSVSPTPSSILQEGDGVRKSGPIVLMSRNKKKGLPLYAVLSDRALELYESEKSHRKKKGTKSIIDLSRCFNVSLQTYLKARAECVCLLMPDECFEFRGESAADTADWHSSLLHSIISSRALHLGRPVFASEFFECVWEVYVCAKMPKLKIPPEPSSSKEVFPNFAEKASRWVGRRRLCFYPHAVVICKFGIESTSHCCLSDPPFRANDFLEFTCASIASYGFQEKYFIIRLGRIADQGACEIWMRCESDETAIEVNRKLSEILRRERERKECALLALVNMPKPGGHHHHRHHSSAKSTSSPIGSPSNGIVGGKSEGSPELETISEDEQQHRSPSTSISSSGDGGRSHRKKHSSLSQSAREKRLELRECKAKVDSLEEEEQRLREQQNNAARQEAAASGDPCWRWRGTYPLQRLPSGPAAGSSTGGTLLSHSHSRPAYLGCPPEGKAFRRRGSATSMNLRGMSDGAEQQQSRNWNRNSPLEINNNGTDNFNLHWMEHNDPLNLLGSGASGSFFYGPEEETEDSGGTLRIPCCDCDGNNSQGNSRSASSLNLAAQSIGEGGNCVVEALVECHVAEGGSGAEDEAERMGTEGKEEEEEGTSTEEEDNTKVSGKRIDLAAVRRRRKQQQEQQQSQQMRDEDQQTLTRKRQMTTESSREEAADEADQSCCSSSIASSSSATGRESNAAVIGTDPSISVADQTHQKVDDHDYMTMDKVSCSSDSFSHLLSVPNQQWDRSQPLATCCPEEICSYTSDSGDSCYSSMINGQINGPLNPRALSFSSTNESSCAGGNGGGGGRAHLGRGTGRTDGRHWTMGVTGMGLHRNNGGANNVHAHPTHFSSPRNHISSIPGGPTMTNSSNNSGNFPDSSSSSRFSMETSLITPLEEDERQVNFAEEERDKLDSKIGQRCVDELRKRAFSLGSKSWITKPLRKLSSHGVQSSLHHRQPHGSASRSGTSSLAGSFHADLAPSDHNNSQTRLSLSQRLGSSSSFASSTIVGGHHNRSDSIGSSHSAALSLSGAGGIGSQKRMRKKQPSDEHLRDDDLVELVFMPNTLASNNTTAYSAPKSNLTQHAVTAANRSAQCVATLAATTPTDALRNNPLRARTSSCDEQNQQQAKLHYQQCVMGGTMGGGMSTPRERASAGALDKQRGSGVNTGGSCSFIPREQQPAQQHQLRPSESFIRSIQQQQQEMYRERQQQQHQRQKRHKPRMEFPLQEVQCFIAPAEREKIDAMTTRDSMSIHSQRSGSGSTFETIQECAVGPPISPSGSGRSNNRPASRSSTSLVPVDSHKKICQSITAEDDEDEYVLGSAESALRIKA